MQKPKNHKLKTYTALSLALSLASPISVFAAEETNNTAQPSPVSLSDSMPSLENKEIKPYTINISPTLLEDETKILYEVNLEKSTEEVSNLSAHIFLPQGSNLDNIRIIADDNIEEDIKAFKDNSYIEFSLPEGVTSFKLEASIKDESTDNLFFDLAILDKEQGFKKADRIQYNIKTSDDTKTLGKVEWADIVSDIKGKFISEDEIEWSGYLINPTEESKKVNYELKLSDSQSFDDSLIKIVRYALDENNKLALSEENPRLESLNTELTPNDFLTFTFTTKANEEEREFTANEARVTREIQLEEDNDKADKVLEDTSEEKIEKEQTEEPVNKETNTTEEKDVQAEVEKSIKELQKASSEIEEVLIGAGVDLTELEDTTKENETTKPESKEDIGKTPTDNQESKEETTKQEENSTDDKEKTEINQVKKAAEEEIAKVNDQPVDYDKLTKDINDANQEIVDLLKENGIVSPVVVQPQNLLTSTNTSTDEDNLDIDSLIKEIIDTTVEIEDLARQIYGDKAYESAISLKKQGPSKDLDKLITDIEASNSEIVATLAQAFKTEDASYTDEDIKELVSILNRLEYLKSNSKKAADSEQTDSRETSNIDDLSKGLVNDISKKEGEVKTVTLDPLDEKSMNDLTKNITNPVFKNKVIQILKEAGL